MVGFHQKNNKLEYSEKYFKNIKKVNKTFYKQQKNFKNEYKIMVLLDK